MNNIVEFPVIAGVEIITDEQGRFNLNALHRASGLGDHKRPSKWLNTEPAQQLVDEVGGQSPLEGFDQKVVNTLKGGLLPGTFAHELIAISYAGWISPSFQLKVNQTFIDYRSGKLKPVENKQLDLATMLISAGEELRKKDEVIKVLEPKAEFHDKVAVAEDAVSVAEAAKVIGTGQKRLFAFLRKKAWVTRLNEPYQAKIEAGLLDVKVRNWNHPDQGLKSSITALVTGKGLVQLQKLYSEVDSISQS